MRIALFSGNYNYVREGANQALNRMVAYAGSKGHKVRVYSPVTDTPAFEPEGELVPVPSVRLPVRGEFRLALSLPEAIRRDVRGFAPDIIHVSTPDILGTRAQTLARTLGVPVVASLHTRFETYFEHYGLGWARPLAEAHLRRFYRRSDHVLVPIPVTVDEIKQMRGDGRVSLWSRGVDRERFDPARRDLQWRRARGFDDEDVVLLFFGRLVLEKGVEEFVSVARQLHERSVAVRTLIVGDGPAREKFDQLEDAVLIGHLDGDELGRAVASADILLHPSRTEAFGNVVLEAMSAGLTVVCADADSARALVDDGRTGVIYSPDDRGRLLETLAALAGDPFRRQVLARGAREASARFSWDKASQSVLGAYEVVTADAGALKRQR
jgi:glycosyltransferase involved in cell wall biosynthesis